MENIMKQLPKISIVTPSFNQGHFIEETIVSILDQGYPNLEYIIMDAGSTDNTVEVIKKYEKHITHWVSEKDSGQANAINKGLKHCTGEIFNWLNSDDYLEQGALVKIADAFADTSVQAVAGQVRNFSETDEEVIQNQHLSAKGLMCWEKDVKFVQPGVWLRRALLDRCGGIDEQYHYAFDWDLYIRYLYNFPEVKEIPELLVHFRLHGQSKTQSLSERFAIEERKIIEKIAALPEYGLLHKSCRIKTEKTKWTALLADTSQAEQPFLKKLMRIMKAMPAYRSASFSRQTAGALKAFLQKRKL